MPHVSASAARQTVKRAVQRAGSKDNAVVLNYLQSLARPLGRPRRRRDTATMDIEKLSSMFAPASLVKAGVPTASVALLTRNKMSTHVITTGAEDKDTLYQACSISKAITGLAVAKLIDQGHLEYSTLISNHLPQKVVDLVVDSKTKHLFRHLTVRHLLSHTSGLSQHGFPGYDARDGLPNACNVLAGTPPANTPMVHFTTFPGAQFSYSGGGFVILQLFLEALLLKPFASIMQETVLEPLGMTRSYFDLPKNEANYSVPYLTGYLKAPSGPFRFIELAAAGLWTTPSDLLKAIDAVQTSLDATPDRFLSQATAMEMLKPVQYVRGGYSIAHGWFVTDNAFGHAGGNEPGYGCYMIGLRPKTNNNATPTMLAASPWGSALAVMTNGPYTNQAVWNVVSAVFHLQNWRRLAVLPGGMVDGEWRAVPASAGTEIDASWKDWIGDWEDGWKIVSIDEKPAIQFGEGEVEAMVLVAAAAPVQLPGKSKRVVALVVDGLEMQVTLTCERGEKVVVLLQRESTTLRRR